MIPCYYIYLYFYKLNGYLTLKIPELNLFPQPLHCQIPFAILFTFSFSQKGHLCFFLCKLSTLLSLFLDLNPYPAPNLPDAFAFLVFVAILNFFSKYLIRIDILFLNKKLAFKSFCYMGPPGFEPGSRTPKARSITRLAHGPTLNTQKKN